MNARGFFDYARKRYQLMLDKQADFERPWTNDPILQTYRFCNVFREDDKVTQWIRKHITYENYGDRLLGAMVIARWFNRIETLEHLLPLKDGSGSIYNHLLSCWADDLEGWEATMRGALGNLSPLVTGAYMIKTPAKMNKLDGILWCLKQFLPDAIHLQVRMEEETTLEGVTEVLAGYPYLGPFMAYEVVTDLRHTPLLGNAPDIMTWANPGPGCARGLARVLELPTVDWFNRHSSAHVKEMMGHMQDLLRLSKKADYWPQRWPAWEMRDVEHTLCEFDKYERARLGEGKPKQKYKPAA